MLLGELLAVLGKKLVPLFLVSGALGGVLAVKVVDFLGDSEGLIRVEAKLLLELLDIVSLERRAVDAVSALLQGAVTDGSLKLDQSGLVLDGLSLLEGSLHGIQVSVTVLDGDDLPAVSFVALDNILSEGAVGVSIDGDVVVVVDADQVSELQVTSERRGFARDTLHQATIAEEAVGVVIDNVEARLVEDGTGVSLGHGETDSIADTLSQGASGDLDAGGIMGLGVAGGDAVHRLLGS